MVINIILDHEGGNIMENRENSRNLPTEISVWTKIRNFLCQDIKLELTPKQEKVFQEVHDFWTQEITGQSVHDFLFYEITGESVKNFLFKEIEITDDVEL